MAAEGQMQLFDGDKTKMALAILRVSNNLYVIPVPGEARRKININPEMVEF